MHGMRALIRLRYSSFSSMASPKFTLVVPPPKSNQFSHNNYTKFKNYSTCVAPLISSALQNEVEVLSHNMKVDNDNSNSISKGEEKFEEVRGVSNKDKEIDQMSVIPNNIAITLDGNRRWLKFHGLDLDYRPFFQAIIRFVDCCLKWGVGSGTTYVYGLGNLNHRSQEATDLMLRQFEIFLEEYLNKFTRDGIKVTMVGEKSKLTKSCQTTIKKVEEATRNNTNLDLMIGICYTSQRDIVNATTTICKKVMEGKMELEDVNEDLIQQQLSLCGSRPPIDLFIRTGGQRRVGMLLGWQAPHVELYFTNTHAPDFGEEGFLDALRSYQQRDRWFGK